MLSVPRTNRLASISTLAFGPTFQHVQTQLFVCDCRSLALNFEDQLGGSEALDALVANVCRRCTSLRSLELAGDIHAQVSEGVLARVSQLTGLTSLALCGMADCGDVCIVRIAQKVRAETAASSGGAWWAAEPRLACMKAVASGFSGLVGLPRLLGASVTCRRRQQQQQRQVSGSPGPP